MLTGGGSRKRKWRSGEWGITVPQMDLTFELVDDLAFAAQRGQGRLESHVVATKPTLLGPLIEYVWLRRRLPLPSLTTAQSTPLTDEFRRFASTTSHAAGSLNDGAVQDFIHVPASFDGFRSTAWVTFMSRMRFAAEAHGFSTPQATGLVAALGEMASNAFEHSQKPETAIAAFRTETSIFEFVVADAGIGAAASLRLSPEFQHIHDTGEALKLCITDGVSRHGHDAKRGHGFQELFSRLADFNARVRIRSDDQVVDLRGDCLGPRLAIPAGRAPMRGFLVSTQCFPPT